MTTDTPHSRPTSTQSLRGDNIPPNAFDILNLIFETDYPDPQAVPLSHERGLWHLRHALADLCPGMGIVAVDIVGSDLKTIEGKPETAEILSKSDQCFHEIKTLVWGGWALNHLGVFPRKELSQRSIAHTAAWLAGQDVQAETFEVKIHPHILVDPPIPDEDDARWTQVIRAHVQAMLVELDTKDVASPSRRSPPRL